MNTRSCHGTQSRCKLPSPVPPAELPVGSVPLLRKPADERNILPKTTTQGLWTPQAVLIELQRLQSQGEKLHSRALRRTNPSVYGAAIRLFGSFKNAVLSCGIDYALVAKRPKRWNKTTVIAEIQKLYSEGCLTHHCAMQRKYPALVIACYRYCGGLRNAIEAAGVNPELLERNHSWEPHEILIQLQERAKSGRPMFRNALRREDLALVVAAERLFGSYRNAALAAGLPVAVIEHRRLLKYPAAWVVQRIRDRYINGKTLSSDQLRRSEPSLHAAARKRFGCYKNAIEAAGLDYAKVVHVVTAAMPSYLVVRRLKAAYQAGRDVRYTRLRESDPKLLRAAERRFGSYRKAVIAAGLDYPVKPPLGHWTPPLVLQTLRELHANGTDLRYSSVREQMQSLFEASRYYFSNYVQAIAEAGLNYDQIVLHAREAVQHVRSGNHKAIQ